MKLRSRKQIFVDSKLQGTVAARSVAYWTFCLLTLMMFLLCWELITGPRQPALVSLRQLWFHYAPAAVASLLLLPLVVIDSIRLTNRVAGPMLRLRRAMQRLAQGEPVQPIIFREGDFWQEIADAFNQIAASRSGGEAALSELVEGDSGDNDHADDDVLRRVPVA